MLLFLFNGEFSTEPLDPSSFKSINLGITTVYKLLCQPGTGSLIRSGAV